MIIRALPDGSMLMIAQTEHCRLSGVFAAHWGNAQFARPTPYESAVKAAMFHDCGWYRYETSPIWDPDTRSTPSFMQVPLDDVQLAAFQWGTDWLTEIDPYAGLLINKHRTGLWRGRYGTMTHPVVYNAKNLSDRVEAFIARNEQVQADELKAFDDEEFQTNYRLLQAWDFLSLYLCATDPAPDHIDPVPQGYGAGAAETRLTMTPLGDGRIRLAPYPFDVDKLPAEIRYKHLASQTFDSREAFLAAYYGATPVSRTFTFVP